MAKMKNNAHTKRPVEQSVKPAYPERANADMGRRNFLTILGMGAASVSVFKACGGARPPDPKPRTLGSPPAFAPPPPPKNPDKPDPPIEPPEPPPQIDGGISAPHYSNVRIPATGSMNANLPGDVYVSFSLIVSHDHPQVAEGLHARQAEIVGMAQHLIAQNFPDGGFGDDNRRKKAAKLIEKKLRRMLDVPRNDGMFQVDFILVREQILEPLAGDEPAPHW